MTEIVAQPPMLISMSGAHRTAPPWVIGMIGLSAFGSTYASVPEQLQFGWHCSTTLTPPSTSSLEDHSLSSKESILEIKRLSGLTWEELGKVFDVTRRSVHNWARGEAVTADHDTKIQATLAKIRRIHQGYPQSTASKLRSLSDGAPLYSLLTTIPLSALGVPGSEMQGARNGSNVDESTLMANWRPVAPFRDRWEDEPIEDVVPVGNYPVKRLKVASKRLG